jgi:hypothetical protein
MQAAYCASLDTPCAQSTLYTAMLKAQQPAKPRGKKPTAEVRTLACVQILCTDCLSDLLCCADAACAAAGCGPHEQQ